MWKRPKSSKEEESCRNRNDLVPYVNHDVSDFDSEELSDGEWRFSCEEQKRCRRIVCSVVKKLFKNNFFRKLCGKSKDVDSGGKNVNGFPEEIMEFLKNSHEGRLKILDMDEKRNHL